MHLTHKTGKALISSLCTSTIHLGLSVSRDRRIQSSGYREKLNEDIPPSLRTTLEKAENPFVLFCFQFFSRKLNFSLLLDDFSWGLLKTYQNLVLFLVNAPSLVFIISAPIREFLSQSHSYW